MRDSKITLAATILLAFLMLMTASHSYYDPQLTTLQPVLKSYWLIFHVATITIGYAFLGLGFFLGIINMFLYTAISANNKLRLEWTIEELTYINEKTLYIGLFLTSSGTFLGAIVSFGSVIMTFIGVNYYFTKGLHSYASDDPPVFPPWAWITIIGLVLLIAAALSKENHKKKELSETPIPASEKD